MQPNEPGYWLDDLDLEFRWQDDAKHPRLELHLSKQDNLCLAPQTAKSPMDILIT